MKKWKVARASEIKRQAFYALENVRKANIPAKIIGISLFLLILANAVIVFIFADPAIGGGINWAVTTFYTFSTVCFFIEYLARIWIADLAFGDVSPARARLRYILSPLGLIDLMSFLPNALSWFLPLTPGIRNAINIIRLVRLIKLSRYMRGLRTIGRVISKHKHEIIASFLVLALLTVASSVLMYEFEHALQPEKFNNLLAGLWWAVETVTSTGYGDIVPITDAGRFTGAITMILSVALIAIPAGIFSAGFVAEFSKATVRKIERDVKSQDRDADRSSDHNAGNALLSDKKSARRADDVEDDRLDDDADGEDTDAL